MNFKSNNIFIYSFIAMCAAISLIFSVNTSAAKQSKKKDFTVVIDAGHGGKDAGACDNNVKEKDINLGVALKLNNLIKNNLKDVSPVLTRDDDTFISLQQRADIANSNNADLFISIHTNSIDKSNPNRTTLAGSSVYVLGQQKEQNNMNVARRENSVINLERNQEVYEGFDPQKDESYILFEMAQKKNLAQSFKFAEDVQNQLVKIGKRGNRGVHQAGFWVLWATSMPSVLVELDFITNPNSAKFISSEQGQEMLAQAIFTAVKNYRDLLVAQAKEIKNNKNADLKVNTSEEIALLATVEKSSRDVSDYVSLSPNNKRHAQTARRRRSVKSRELSISSDKEAKDIAISSEVKPQERTLAIIDATPSNENHEPEEKLNLDRNKNKDKHKTSKKQGKNNGFLSLFQKENKKENVVAQQSVKSNPKNEPKAQVSSAPKPRHHARLEHTKVVYKIRLLQSDKQLSYNNALFKGFRPDSSYMENNMYNYTLGEATDRSQLEDLYRNVKTKLPEAVVIKRTLYQDLK